MTRRQPVWVIMLLLAALFLSFPAQAAGNVRVYIPDSALPLSLPQMPEAPLIVAHGTAEDGDYEIVFSAPVEEGQQVGTLRVRLGEETVAELPILAAASVPRIGFWGIFRKLAGSLVGL